jgi:hypothetical protein
MSSKSALIDSSHLVNTSMFMIACFSNLFYITSAKKSLVMSAFGHCEILNLNGVKVARKPLLPILNLHKQKRDKGLAA